MSYANFKPTIWSKAIQTALHEKTILANFCNTQFTGEAKLGGTVNIIGAVAPHVFDYDPAAGLEKPAPHDGIKTVLEITQKKAFNVLIDDIDASQMNGVKLLPILCSEAAAKMAALRDRYVSQVAIDAVTNDVNSEGQRVAISGDLTLGTEAKVKAAIDAAILHLREKNVDPSVEARIELPWWMYQLFKNELTDVKTSNDTLIANGVVGWYDGFKVVASNCLQKIGEFDTAMVRTNKAIAFAGTIDKTEAYRPENYFSDAVKGLDVYGAVVSRPDEIYIIKAKKSA